MGRGNESRMKGDYRRSRKGSKKAARMGRTKNGGVRAGMSVKQNRLNE